MSPRRVRHPEHSKRLMRRPYALILLVALTTPAFPAGPPQAIPDQMIGLDELRLGGVPVVRPPPTPVPTPAPRQPAIVVSSVQSQLSTYTIAPDIVGSTRIPLRGDANARPGQPAPSPQGLPQVAGGGVKLDLVRYVNLVRQRNARILGQQLDWLIAEESINNARSYFEAEAFGSAQHEENQTKNTVQEALQRSSLGQFNEYNEHYNAGIEGNTVAGGKVRTFYRLDDVNNNLQTLGQPASTDPFNEFRTFLGATLTQPLLKNRGPAVTKARIHVAERDRDVAYQAYRKEMMRVLAEAINSYYELVTAQTRLGFQRDSIAVINELLVALRARLQMGMSSETEILEAEAALSQRQSQEQSGLHDVTVAKSRVRNFISETPDSYQGTAIDATENLGVEAINLDLNTSLRNAVRLAPEYLSAKAKAEREGIRLAFAQNQLWPQLDLSGTWGVNGLDTNAMKSMEDAINSDNRTWNVLLEMRVPLGGGLRNNSELKAAEFRKMQALHEIKSIEIELANTVYAAIQHLETVSVQITRLHDVSVKNEQLLQVELDQLEAGFSTVRNVLQREEELNKSRDEEIKALMNYKRAMLELELTRGSLLERFGAETPNVLGNTPSVTQAKR